MHSRRNREADLRQDGRNEIDQADRFGNPPGVVVPRRLDNERNLRRAVIDEITMFRLSVFAEALSMVARNDDQA